MPAPAYAAAHLADLADVEANVQPLGPECLFHLAFDVTGAGEMATNHSRREVIRLYREILVTARHITWADDKGLSWCVQPARASNSLKLLSGHRPHALDENMRCGPSPLCNIYIYTDTSAH